MAEDGFTKPASNKGMIFAIVALLVALLVGGGVFFYTFTTTDALKTDLENVSADVSNINTELTTISELLSDISDGDVDMKDDELPLADEDEVVPSEDEMQTYIFDFDPEGQYVFDPDTYLDFSYVLPAGWIAEEGTLIGSEPYLKLVNGIDTLSFTTAYEGHGCIYPGELLEGMASQYGDYTEHTFGDVSIRLALNEDQTENNGVDTYVVCSESELSSGGTSFSSIDSSFGEVSFTHESGDNDNLEDVYAILDSIEQL